MYVFVFFTQTIRQILKICKGRFGFEKKKDLHGNFEIVSRVRLFTFNSRIYIQKEKIQMQYIQA